MSATGAGRGGAGYRAGMLLLLTACLTLPPAGDTPPSDTVILLTERAPTPRWRGDLMGTPEVDRELAEMIQPPLVARYAECGPSWRPGAARWRVEGSGLRLELLAGLTWEDGAPVVVEDALAGLREAQAKGALPGITARDEGGALILEGPGDLLAAASALPLIPAHRPADRALSYGLWRVEPGEEGELLLVGREGPPEWRSDPAMPRPGRMIWRGEPDADRRVAALAREEADVADRLRPEDVARLEESDAVLRRRGLDRLVSVAWSGGGSDAGAAADPEVRRALAQAVDVDGWLDRQFQTSEGDLLARPAVGWIPPTLCRAHHDALPRLRHDPAAAAATLERLGWIDPDGDGLRGRGEVPLRIHLSLSDDPALPVVASWLAAEFRAVGVELSRDARPGGGYDGILLREGPILDLPTGLSIRPTSGQPSAPTSGQIGAALQAQEADREAQPRLFLYWEDELVALHTRIKDAAPDGPSLLGHLEGWKIPPERRLRQPDGQPWPVHSR